MRSKWLTWVVLGVDVLLGGLVALAIVLPHLPLPAEVLEAWRSGDQRVMPAVIARGIGWGIGVAWVVMEGYVLWRHGVWGRDRRPLGKALRASVLPVFFVLLAYLAAWRLVYALVDNPTLFAQQMINGIRLGFVFALIALGYTMVYGIVRLINFAHGDVFMVGAFVSFYAVSRYHWKALPAILLAMVVCALLGVTIERVAYKPLRNYPRIAALITAIGVSFFLEYFSALDFVFTSNIVLYRPRPIDIVAWYIGEGGIHRITEGMTPPERSIVISNVALIVIGISVLCLLLLQYIVHYTKVGKAMRAVAWDKPAARLMGINVDNTISVTFAIGSALAAVGGVLYAVIYPQITVFVGIMPGLKAFVAAVLGGIGSIPGAFVGSLIMGVVDVMSAAYLSSTMRDAIAFSVLIIVLLVRPTGIFGEPEGEKA